MTKAEVQLLLKDKITQREFDEKLVSKTYNISEIEA